MEEKPYGTSSRVRPLPLGEDTHTLTPQGLAECTEFLKDNIKGARITCREDPEKGTLEIVAEREEDGTLIADAIVSSGCWYYL